MAEPIEAVEFLKKISTQFPIFEKDQVLTYEQLNNIQEYLGDENRLTRIKLIGIGIACGLNVSLVDNTVNLTKGLGVTTDGDLLYLDADTIFNRFKVYDDSKPVYSPFIVDDKMIPVFELVDKETKDEAAFPLDQFQTETGKVLSDMVAVFYMESYEHDTDLCSGTDCDNLGQCFLNNAKLLLVEKNSVKALQKSIRTMSELFAKLQEIIAERPIIKSQPNSMKDLADIYRKVCEKIIKSLTAEFKKFQKKDNLLFLNNLSPFELANKEETWTGTLEKLTAGLKNDAGIQYYYDFLKDLVETYNEFRRLLFGDDTWCCPDKELFPKHLLLGNLVPGSDPNENRTGFFASPIVSRTKWEFEHAKFLAKKLDTMIDSFEIPAASLPESLNISITPSFFEDRSLEERAIPFYYSGKSAERIYKNWNFHLHEMDMDEYNYSYFAKDYDPDPGTQKPLEFQIGPYPFFRIEGHFGANIEAALKEIQTQIKQNNLPFCVRAVMLSEDKGKIVIKPGIRYDDLYRFHYLIRKDLDFQLEDAADFSDQYAKQAMKLTNDDIDGANDVARNVNLKKDTIVDKTTIARVALNQNYAGYKADAAWKVAVRDTNKTAAEFMIDLGEVSKKNFVTPLDSIIKTNDHWLDWLDILIKDKEDKQDEKLLFSKFQSENPGLEHFAGVLRGGTFVLVYDETKLVVADFMLPYYCPEPAEEEPKAPPQLPRPPKVVPWINAARIVPKLDKYVDKFVKVKLDTFDLDFDKKWMTKIDAQTDFVKNSVDVIGKVLEYQKPAVDLTDFKSSLLDKFTALQVDVIQNKRSMLDMLKERAADPALPPDTKSKFAERVKETEVGIAKSIGDVAARIEETNPKEVVAGTEAHNVITDLATHAESLDPEALNVVKARLEGLSNKVQDATLKERLKKIITHR